MSPLGKFVVFTKAGRVNYENFEMHFRFWHPIYWLLVLAVVISYPCACLFTEFKLQDIVELDEFKNITIW